MSKADNNDNEISYSGEQTSEKKISEAQNIISEQLETIKSEHIFNNENSKKVLNSFQTDIDETNENIHNDLKVSLTIHILHFC